MSSRVMASSLNDTRLALKPGLAKGAGMMKLTLAAALAITNTFGAPLAAQEDTATNERVIIVLAHPDDELVFAPAIHALAKAGNQVELIFATRGDQGPGVSGLEKGPELASARTNEAMCSGQALGAKFSMVLGMGDGAMADLARTTEGLKKDAEWRFIAAALKKADTVITWGPDGGYGHADHRMISAFVTQVVQAMPADARPELLYPALIHTPLPGPLASQGWATTAPDLATVGIAYDESDLAAATKAVQCHKTQFDEATRAVFVPGFHAGVWKGEVSFRKAL